MTSDKAAQILNESVHIITGRDDTSARPTQASLSNRVDATMSGAGGPTVAEASTGTGKTLAYLSPAAYAASLGERTVISTESLALQSQVVDKDAPVVAEACHRVTGYRPSVAVLKGFSNFSCTARAAENAYALSHGDDLDIDFTDHSVNAAANPAKHVRDLMGDLDRLDPGSHPSAPLTRWALNEAVNDGTGDKFDYEGEMTPEMWDQVAISSTECVGADRCPFAEMCLPRKSRTAAANADIVVTNHTMIGIQAARGVPVVIGSRTLGKFDNVVIDEAHGITSAVRNQGSSFISGLRIHQAVSALKHVLPPTMSGYRAVLEEGGAIGDLIEHELSNWTEGLGEGKVSRLGESDDPLHHSNARARRWVTAVDRALNLMLDRGTANEIRLRRLISRFDGLRDALKDCSTHQKGTARWVEIETPRGSMRQWSVVRYTPVDVSAALTFNVWSTIDPVDDMEPLLPGEEPVREQTALDANGDPELQEDEEERRWLNVSCVSATLPVSFTRDVGLKTQMSHHASPFDEAFSHSSLYIPQASSERDVLALAGDTNPPRLNTRLHMDWASGHIAELVEANGGAALVLAATASAGRAYAEHLRTLAKGRWQVLSQWDGTGVRNITAAWKADPSSVLVGTRSLMTGVDAPGQTCSLVIVDRIPRAASNPVDDARVEKLREDADFDRWSADRFVYGGDASLLLEQAAGRLIRSASDSGMVAILDPRLNDKSAFTYPPPTRALYLKSVEQFEHRISSLPDASSWLQKHRLDHPHG